jgi:hypothetical protein
MRSAIGPLLVVFGLGMTVVLVLLLFVNLGTRTELEATRAEVAELRATIEAMEEGVTADELEQGLVQLEGGIRDWLIATGADGGVDTPSGDGSGGSDGAVGTAIVERLDEILERIDALDARIDEICEAVPVC